MVEKYTINDKIVKDSLKALSIYYKKNSRYGFKKKS